MIQIFLADERTEGRTGQPKVVQEVLADAEFVLFFESSSLILVKYNQQSLLFVLIFNVIIINSLLLEVVLHGSVQLVSCY